jgi:Fe2+ transport system protein FeoA
MENKKITSITSLNKLKIKQKAEIIGLKGSGLVHRRMLDMGLVKGAIIEIEKVAPLGDPIDVKVKGYHLSLRKEEAKNVIVKLL